MFTCTLCNKSFQSPGEYDQHKRQEYLNTLFKCSFCSKIFESKGVYLAHERKHIFKTVHICDCGEKFNNRDSLRLHVKKKHLNESDDEDNLNVIQEKVKQKAIQLAMEKGFDAAQRKHKIEKETLENWIMVKYINIDDENVENIQRLQNEANLDKFENYKNETEVLVLTDDEKSKKQEIDKTEKEREKIAMERRKTVSEQGSIALKSVKQILDKHLDIEEDNNESANTKTEQEAINENSGRKNQVQNHQNSNKCRLCNMILKEPQKAVILKIKEINHYITMHQICPIYGCGVLVRTMNNWNSHLTDSHKPKRLTKEEFNKQLESESRKDVKPIGIQNEKEFSKPFFKPTQKTVDLLTTEDKIQIEVKTNSDGCFDIPKVAARGRTIKPANMGYSRNNESYSVESQRIINRAASSQVKIMDLYNPDNLFHVIASVTMSSDGVFDIKIQNPL